MKKIISLALVLLMVTALLTGCTDNKQTTSDNPEKEQNSTPQQTVTADNGQQVVDTSKEVDTTRKTTESGERYPSITMALAGAVADLYPWNPAGQSKSYVCYLIYETLYRDDGGNYNPYLAKGAPVEVDEYHWDVEIYDNIYDSQGNHITAEDVVYSYDIVFDSGYASKCSMLEGYEAVGEYTIRFTWNKVIDTIDELEWPLCKFYIVSKAAMENPSNDFASYPVGTGPYAVTDFVSGASITVEARDDYWQEESLVSYQGHANVQKIKFQVLSESAQVIIALRNGDIDYTEAQVSNENIDEFIGSDKYTVSQLPANSNYFLMGNFADKYWADENFRKAVYYAIDVTAVAETGNIAPATAFCSPYFTELTEAWKANNDTYQNVTDVNLAKEYLEKSNYDGGEVIIATRSVEDYKNMAVMVQGFLVNIGIDAKVNAIDNTELNAILSDTEGWTLELQSGGSGGNVAIGWNRILNTGDFADGLSFGHNDDSNMHSMYQALITVDGYSDENAEEFMLYVTDHAYAMLLGSPIYNFVYINDLAQLRFKEASGISAALNECVYYIDD